MVEGSDELDVTSCETMKAISGFNPNKQLVLVRNPDYDQATDETRENNIDGLEMTLNTNAQDIFDKTRARRARARVRERAVRGRA